MKPVDFLITGFGPFPGAPVNVSAAFARQLARLASYRWPRLTTCSQALDTDWERAPAQLGAAAELLRPKIILMFGISRHANGFHVESSAWNERISGNRGANRDQHQGGYCQPLDPRHQGAPVLHVGPLAEHIVNRLRARGLVARHSRDAGRYLCNAALFHSLTMRRRMAAPISVFIHLPPVIHDLDTDAGRAGAAVSRLGNRMGRATALRGGLEIIAACAAHAHMRLPAHA